MAEVERAPTVVRRGELTPASGFAMGSVEVSPLVAGFGVELWSGCGCMALGLEESVVSGGDWRGAALAGAEVLGG